MLTFYARRLFNFSDHMGRRVLVHANAVICFVVCTYIVLSNCERHGGVLRPSNRPKNTVENQKRFEGSEHRKIADSLGSILLIAGPAADNFTTINPDNRIVQINESIVNLQFVNSAGEGWC
jgi:hypothetical protein